MGNAGTTVEPIVQELHLPAGLAGPDAIAVDVRCFLVPHAKGLLLVDAGPQGSAGPIVAALARLGAAWSDISDVVLTHSHPDHTGGLGEVLEECPTARVWAGAADCAAIAAGAAVQPLNDGDRVRDLQVLATPGHTPGHISLLHDDGILFVGDAVATVGGTMRRAPKVFTADAEEAEKSLRRLESLTAGRWLFAHGPEVHDPAGELSGLLQGRR